MADPVQLDHMATHAGLLERLCLHETITPGLPGYDDAESLKAMWFIRQMIANRLRFPRVFGNKKGLTETELMKIPKQFPGFETYPNLSSGAMVNVNQCVKLANDPHGWRHAKFLKHVQNAIVVAQAPSVPLDQAVPGAAGWKKHGAPSPGAKYAFWRTLQGNDFYTTPMSSGS